MPLHRTNHAYVAWNGEVEFDTNFKHAHWANLFEKILLIIYSPIDFFNMGLIIYLLILQVMW